MDIKLRLNKVRLSFKEFYDRNKGKTRFVITSTSKEDLEKLKKDFGLAEMITEGRQKFKVAPYMVSVDTPHGYQGKHHLHFDGKGQSGTINHDGSIHDSFDGRIPNKVADFAREKLGYYIPPDNRPIISESMLNEDFSEIWAIEIWV